LGTTQGTRWTDPSGRSARLGSTQGTHWTGPILCVLCVLSVLGVNSSAQFQMPDAKEMSGIPRPVDDLPAGSISVRLIRGSLSNNIPNHPVQLRVGDRVLTVRTDDAGRAQFDRIEAGAAVKASADVDGEHLESAEFQAPSSGGIRMLLVATDKSKGPATHPDAPPVSGQVLIGAQSRIVVEPGDEAVTLYYLLDISNTARVPVNPPGVFMFDMPKEAIGTTIMRGSTDKASVTGPRVRVQGPFPPGNTSLQIGCELPAGTGTVNITQTFPANLEQFAVIVKKAGETVVRSPQITRQQEFPADGEIYIASTGGAVPAGHPISIDVSGLPHHSRAPRSIALALVVGIAIVGLWSASRPSDTSEEAAERKRLVAKRDKLLNDVVRLEQDHRNGRMDEGRYTTRRQELMAALEHIYGALDSDDAAWGVERADPARAAAPLGELRTS
jgi:hypothetical protein